jgi:hypothetical protein
MTIPARVIAYLRAHALHVYCDECISQKLGRRMPQVQPMSESGKSRQFAAPDQFGSNLYDRS